jgi:lysophospholipid acyltransferase (LPLAT)-like uncharacterized protein
MKIRHPWLITALAFVIAWVLRLWVGSLRFRAGTVGQHLTPDQQGLPGRYLYAFWHENLLLLAYHYAQPDVHVLISEHADGQLITEVCQRLGFGVVRGSKTRNGARAMRDMLRLTEAGHVAITPDGPRGPRRQLQSGLIYLAARSGLPIVPIGVGYRRPWRARSWDRFAVPRPFSRARLVHTPPIHVPRHVGMEGLEGYRLQVEEALRRATEAAEQWAESGAWPAWLEEPEQGGGRGLASAG